MFCHCFDIFMDPPPLDQRQEGQCQRLFYWISEIVLYSFIDDPLWSEQISPNPIYWSFLQFSAIQHKYTVYQAHFSYTLSSFSKEKIEFVKKKLPNTQPTRGLNVFTKETKVISQVLTQILIKNLQNLNQAPTSKSQPNISVSSKPKLKNLDQT